MKWVIGAVAAGGLLSLLFASLVPAPAEPRKASPAEIAQQREKAHVKALIDYTWRMKVVRVCVVNKEERYLLRGADGRLWLSPDSNPGRAWASYDYPNPNLDPVAGDVEPWKVCS